jgi:spore coat protein CotH
MALCRLVTSANDAEFAAKLGDYIELDEFARFMAVMVYLSDLDGMLGPGQNFYLFLAPKTQKLTFIPWDQDHSFGQFAMRGTQEQREKLSIRKPWQGENRFLERVFKVEAFRKLYSANLERFSRTILKPERFSGQVDTIAATIRPAVKEESEEKLARFDKVVAGESISGGGFGRFGGGELKPIKPFVKIRAQSVEEQVAGKSEGEMIEGFGFGGRRPGGERVARAAREVLALACF